MGIWTSIVTFLQSLLGALNIFKAYFPPKSKEQKIEDGDAAIDSQIANEESTGRPQ